MTDGLYPHYLFVNRTNWLITQYIKRKVNNLTVVDVKLQIELRSKCIKELGCNKESVKVGIKILESENPDKMVASDFVRYRDVAKITVKAKVEYNTTVDIKLRSPYSGFFVALLDEDGCVEISRVILYYKYCPKATAFFVIWPNTLAPNMSSTARVVAKCVPGAQPVGDISPWGICTSEGIWSHGGSGCVCSDGFKAEGHTCTAS